MHADYRSRVVKSGPFRRSYTQYTALWFSATSDVANLPAARTSHKCVTATS